MISRLIKSSPYGLVKDSRAVITLGDLCDAAAGIQTGPFGSQLHSSDYVQQGTPIITVENLNENYITGDSIPFVSKEDLNRLSKYMLKQGDIVFSRVGSVDRRALVTEREDGWLFSGRILRIRTNPDLIDPIYLSYFFGLSKFKDYIRRIAVGATMPSLNTQIMMSIPVVVPPLKEQHAIGQILRQIDEKIRINQQISKTLEEIAQTIFKSWFVDFDPVHAKARGEQPFGMDENTAALFPDSFEDSELGSIPSGWSSHSADELFEITIGRTPPRKEPKWFCSGDSGVPWVSIRDMGTYGVYSVETNEGLTNEAIEKFRVPVVPENSVLMSFKLTLGKLCLTDRPLATNEAIAHFKQKNESQISSYFAYLWLKEFDVEKLDSTSSIATATNSTAIKNITFLLPPSEICSKFDNLVKPIFDQIKNKTYENATLSKIRDSLLPRLISGELEIPEDLLAS